jgi:hypothetical protein
MDNVVGIKTIKEKKNNFYGNRAPVNRASAAKNASKNQSLVTKNEVRSLIKGAFESHTEKKWWPLLNGGVTVDYTGNIYGLTDVPQGDLDTTRDGDSINLESIKLGIELICGDATNIVRFIMFRWKPNTTPAAADIWQAVASNVAPLYQPLHDNMQEYDILVDKLYTLHSYQPVVTDMIIYDFKNPKVQYVSGTTTGSNKIYMYFVSDSGAATHPSLYFVSKLLFRDS